MIMPENLQILFQALDEKWQIKQKGPCPQGTHILGYSFGVPLSQSSLTFTHHIFFPVVSFFKKDRFPNVIPWSFQQHLLSYYILESYFAYGTQNTDWHVESTICTSVGYRWKKGVAKHFPSYQYVSRCCLFLSKFRIIGKPHDKIAATFEHPDLQKYKLSIDNSLHSSIPIMFYWCLEILI